MPNAASTFDDLLQRHRLAVLAGIVATVVVAWAYLIVMAAGMEMDAGGLGKMSAMATLPQIRSWTAAEFGLMFAMWAIMMAGMMLPSATPMILLFTRSAAKHRALGNSVPSAALFIGGYLVSWTVFSLAATMLQWGLEEAALVSKMMRSTSVMLGGSLLIAAGIYQLTPLKHACLKHCQTPIQFLIRHWRPGNRGAFAMGVHHGSFCVGCCWALMALLFVGGVMNLIWIAALTIFVLLEKVTPWLGGRAVSYVSGVGLIAWGIAVLTQ